MATISLCMIVKNEEDVLQRCLASAAPLVDEMIIVDTGSTDRTVEIAQQFTDKVPFFEWINDFAAARNYAFRHATCDYIMWLDADDMIPFEEHEAFLALKATLHPGIDSVRMKYHLTFDAENRPVYSLTRNRVVRRERNFQWYGVVHEYLDVFGNIIDPELGVRHNKLKEYTDRNLQIYRKLHASGKYLTARDFFYFGNELSDNSFHEEAVAVYDQFLNRKDGWIEDNIAACLKMSDCYAALLQTEEQMAALHRTFQYGKPRAEACCKLALLYLERNDLETARFWYDLATRVGEPPKVISVYHDPTMWSHLPHIQLTLIYDRLGDRAQAIKHHNIAKKLAPTNSAVLHNEAYFKRLRKSKKKS
ncbi:MAG: tetratricopeptide repeat-containing glycosyltransferase family 2 protein [Bacilli bacterium]